MLVFLWAWRCLVYFSTLQAPSRCTVAGCLPDCMFRGQKLLSIDLLWGEWTLGLGPSCNSYEESLWSTNRSPSPIDLCALDKGWIRPYFPALYHWSTNFCRIFLLSFTPCTFLPASGVVDFASQATQPALFTRASRTCISWCFLHKDGLCCDCFTPVGTGCHLRGSKGPNLGSVSDFVRCHCFNVQLHWGKEVIVMQHPTF